jgi:ATP-dependent DNA helicase RecG
MLDGGVQYLKGVGPRRAALMEKLGIRSLRDLLFYPPRRYLDRTLVKPISGLRPGETVTVFGRVSDSRLARTRRGLTIFSLLLDDGTGLLRCLWFNQPYLRERFPKDQPLVVSGQVRWDRGPSMASPEYELLDSGEAELVHTGRIVPLYPSTAGLSNRQLRTVIRHALDAHLKDVAEDLPPGIAQARGLMPVGRALENLHFPPDMDAVGSARQRLAYQELLALQLLLASRRQARLSRERSRPLKDRTWADDLARALPFPLTAAQQKASAEISADLESERPMYRLLQGDVGSGKTVVALAAVCQAARSGFQSAFMAPTEILAEQHFLSLAPWLEKLGIAVSLLTSKTGKPARAKILDGLRSGKVQACIGTHALIQQDVGFASLGLAVIDEQHRFGVRQRAAVMAKGHCPHVLVMTATPIPRTLSMAVYGDLDVSVIDQMPPGRTPPVTRWTTEGNRGKMLDFVSGQLEKGRQAFFVCPVIEETESQDTRAAVRLHQQLCRRFPRFQIGLVHGRLKIEERRRTMEQFRRNQVQALAATTVIEVGIDVPNATVMVVEQAERFGLSQLHQLRGRVGRGPHRSYCILMAGERLGPEARARLEALQGTSDGFRIAEEDLRLRGPGEFWGSRQHGLPELRLANLVTDSGLVPLARQDALEAVGSDPGLARPEHRGLRQMMLRHFGGADGLLGVG